jgi:hypothetical protein
VAVVSGDTGASLDLFAGDSCDALLAGQHDLFTRVRVSMPGGGTTEVPIPDGFDDICGGGAGYFTSDSPPPESPQSALEARIDAPAVAIAGTTLRYTVTLTNPTGRDVALDPCPTYEEYVATAGNPTGPVSGTVTSTELHYRLNCSEVRSIAAGDHVTYAMELAIPADHRTGPAKFGWISSTGDVEGPAAAQILTVVPG